MCTNLPWSLSHKMTRCLQPLSKLRPPQSVRFAACYLIWRCPASAIAFWERMSKSGGDQPPEFLSTDPGDQTSIAQIKAWLPEARSYYRGK